MIIRYKVCILEPSGTLRMYYHVGDENDFDRAQKAGFYAVLFEEFLERNPFMTPQEVNGCTCGSWMSESSIHTPGCPLNNHGVCPICGDTFLYKKQTKTGGMEYVHKIFDTSRIICSQSHVSYHKMMRSDQYEFKF